MAQAAELVCEVDADDNVTALWLVPLQLMVIAAVHDVVRTARAVITVAVNTCAKSDAKRLLQCFMSLTGHC